MNHRATLLGYAGLIPFIGIPLLVVLDFVSLSEGALYFSQYSAIILSFFGGIHWHDALQNKRHQFQMYIAMLPSIVAWVALITLATKYTLMLFPLAYGLILIYDLKTLTLPASYKAMRVQLTSIVIVCHFIMLLLS